MHEYIVTKERLEEVSAAKLGHMGEGSFEDFAEKAQQTGLSNPHLIIETVLKEPSDYGVTEVVYPISDFEWDVFVSDAETMAEYIPVVHVVDGDKYKAHI